MKKSTTITLIIILAILFGIGAWALGRNSAADKQPTPAPLPSPQRGSSDKADSGTGVKALVNYTLPDGWKEASCEAKPETVYILPAGATVDCAADPSAPVSLSIDPQSTSDCSQLDGKQDVRKHVCKSRSINGKKSLQATTEYMAASSYKSATTISDYFIPAADKVVKVEYRYSGENTYQTGFDQLAQSVSAR